MGHLYYGMDGTAGAATFEINEVASDWEASGAGAVIEVTPITIPVGVDAITDSTATCTDGQYIKEVIFAIGATPYSAGIAEISIYNALGSQVIQSAIDLTTFAADSIVHFPFNSVNGSGYEGVLRISLAGTPVSGSMSVTLDRAPAPVA